MLGFNSLKHGVYFYEEKQNTVFTFMRTSRTQCSLLLGQVEHSVHFY